MKRISLGNRLTPYLLITCLVLAGVVALQWRIGARTGIEGPAEAPPAAAEAPPARTAFVAPGIEAFSEILERPLFTAGREPAEEPAVATPTTPAIPTAPIRLRLEGVALTPQTRVAVVRDLATNQLLRLAEGAEHQGWVVETVHAAGATLKQGQQTQELVLEVDKNPQLQGRSAPRVGVLSGARGGHIGVRRRTPPYAASQQGGGATAPGEAPAQAAQKEDAGSEAAPADQKDAAGQNGEASSISPSQPSAPSPVAPQAQASEKKPEAATP
jgi:hypothetical protein